MKKTFLVILAMLSLFIGIDSTSAEQFLTAQLNIREANLKTNLPALSNEDKKIVNELVNNRISEKELAKKDTSNAGIGKFLQNIFSEYWVQFMALVVSVIGVFLAISGYSFANKSKQKYLKKFLHEIDDAYTSYKWKSKRCEAELYRLKDQVEDQLKAGKIDENTYQLLEKRIDKYLDEIKYAEERPIISAEAKKQNAKDLSDQIEESLERMK